MSQGLYLLYRLTWIWKQMVLASQSKPSGNLFKCERFPIHVTCIFYLLFYSLQKLSHYRVHKSLSTTF